MGMRSPFHKMSFARQAQQLCIDDDDDDNDNDDNDDLHGRHSELLQLLCIDDDDDGDKR